LGAKPRFIETDSGFQLLGDRRFQRQNPGPDDQETDKRVDVIADGELLRVLPPLA
jgi:hypothetical protein